MKVDFPPDENPIMVNQVDRHEQLYLAREIHNVCNANQPKSTETWRRSHRNQRPGEKSIKANPKA